MQLQEKTTRPFLQRLLDWRTKIISSIESLEQPDSTACSIEKNMILCATVAILFLLFLGAIVLCFMCAAL